MVELLDIEKYIKEHKLPKVTNYRSFLKEEPTIDGLYSQTIFGTTKKDKSTMMGYIDLQSKILHPLIYKNLKKINSIFNKIFDFKMTIVDGQLHIKDENQNKDKSKDKLNQGMNVSWLYEEWPKIKLDNYKTHKNEDYIDFLKTKSRDEIFITKLLVIPQAFREYVEENGRLIEDEITGIYKRILLITQSSDFKESDYMKFLKDQANQSKTNVIQQLTNTIHEMFIQKLGGGSVQGGDAVKGKKAIMRSKVLSKRINNVSRLVANARPDIPFNGVALPWYVIIYLFDVFVIKYLLKHPSMADDLGLKDASTEQFGKHIDYIYKNIESYMKNDSKKLDIWYEVLEGMLNEYSELGVMTKRDPAWDKNSYIFLKPIIMKGMNYHLVINSALYVPLGGDSFSTNYFGYEENTQVVHQDNTMKITTNNNTVLNSKSMHKLFKQPKT